MIFLRAIQLCCRPAGFSVRPLCLLAALGVCLLAGALAAPTSQAQTGGSIFDTPASSGSSGGGMDINSWQVETVLLVLAMLLAAALAFLAVYPYLLEKKRWWPRNAYAASVAVLTTLVFAAALALFWEDLVLPSRGPVTALNRYGIKGGALLLWLVVEVLIVAVLRSPQTGAPAKR
jgi:hypothetical protein